MMEKGKSIGVTIFGWIFIIQALLFIPYLFISYIKVNNELKNILSLTALFMANAPKYSSYGNIFIVFTYSIALLFCLIYIICGIGILRIKPWARYVVIALALTYIASILNKSLFFGWQSLTIQDVVIKTAFSYLLLYFFIKKTALKQSEPKRIRFTLKSRYGIVICLIIFFTLLFPSSLLMSKVYYSLRYKKPFFNIKPQIIKLKQIDKNNLLDSNREVEILEMRMLIPKDFVILNFSKSIGKEYMITLSQPSSTDKGVISLSKMPNIYEMIKKTLSVMRFKDAYECERAFHTNNWNPILVLLRNIGTPEGENFKIEEIDSPKIKGFIRSIHNKNKWVYICSLYSKDNRIYREMLIVMGDKDFSKNDLLNIISSLNFIEEKKADSQDYYQQGLKALDSGDYITAQFKFANAYSLSPENPKYGYILAKTLLMNGEKSYHSTERILKNILELEPNYQEAKELLEAINKPH